MIPGIGLVGGVGRHVAINRAGVINYQSLYPTPSDIGSIWQGGSTPGLITTDADWTSFITASAAGGITGVVATAHTLTLPLTITNTPASQVMLRGESSSSKGNLCSSTATVMNAFTLGLTSSNWTFKWLKFGDAAATSGRCLSRAGTTHDNIRFYGCEFFGSDLDANGNYAAGSPTTVNAFGYDGSTSWVNFIFVGNYIHDCYVGVTNDATTSGVVFNNIFDRNYTDPSNVTVTATNSVKMLFNRFSRAVGLASDTGNPHVDAIQIVTNTVDVFDCEIIGNIIFNGNSRANMSCIFGNGTSGYYSRFKISGNLLVTDMTAGTPSHFISLDRIKDCYVFGNISVTRTPGSGSGSTAFLLGTEASGGRTLIGYNITDGTSTAYSGVAKVSNNELTHSLAQYQTVMSWAADPTTIAECITSATRTSSLTRYVDYTNLTINSSNEIGWIPLLSTYNVATSANNTTNISNWAKVIGGPTTQSVSVKAGSAAGSQWRSADDTSGTNATSWSSSSGSVARGKFIQVGNTASASEVTTTTTTLTVNSYDNAWSSTTLDTSAFSFVTNSGTIYSTSTGALSATTYNKWIIAFRIKSSAATTAQTILNGGASNNSYVRYDGNTGLVILQMAGSLVVKVNIPTLVANGTTVTAIMSIDFTQNTGVVADDFANGFKSVANGSLLAPTQQAFDTTSGTRTFSLSSFLGTIGLMDRTDGAGTGLAGEFHFLWVDGFNTAMPDITDPSFFNKFSAQLLNSNGSAVDATFGQPLLYYTNLTKGDTLTTANAGSASSNTTLTNVGAYT